MLDELIDSKEVGNECVGALGLTECRGGRGERKKFYTLLRKEARKEYALNHCESLKSLLLTRSRGVHSSDVRGESLRAMSGDGEVQWTLASPLQSL